MKLNRLSLNVVGLNRIGLNRIGSPSRGSSSGSDRPYIDPEVLASLKAVCICYGKSNDDPDRAVVKNLVDPDNPFVISNAAFKLNSGFGEYKVDFTTWSKVAGTSIITDSKYILTDEKAITSGGYFLWNRLAKDSFKVKISNIPNGGWMSYRYRITEEDTQFSSLFIREDGIYTLPATIAGGDVDFFISTVSAPAKDWVGLTIEQIPSFQGAFVTDGINDLITSTKTVQEMLGGSNEITVVSMIHQIGLIQVYGIALTNYIRNNGGYLRSAVNSVGKTGIYGYTANNLNQSIKDRVKVINTILGDKKDYMASISDSYVLDDSLFHVQNYAHDGIIAGDGSQLAWYWTIIANKVLTTDQINQVIAYFNLDRTLNPDILCNTIKQGITNENHAEFGDKLIDFSGNGRDIQLNNIAWDGDSGIGKYNYPGWKLTANKAGKYRNIRIYQTLNGTYTAKFEGVTELYSRVGIELEILSKNRYVQIKEDGIYSVDPVEDATELQVRFGDYTGTELYDCDITITQIPSHAGALCLDGINDFGKVTGMPVYKDYTFIIDYERISYTSEGWGGAIVSKSPNANNGAFISMMANSAGLNKQLFSFGGVTAFIKDDLSRNLFWQTKYKSENTELTVGEGVDGDTLWLGTLRDNDSRFFNGAIYSLMSFPYSMSEFLIERQLKKHKLGTLYPDMVEFRPIVKSNVPYDNIVFYYKNERIENGTYLATDSLIGMHIRLSSNPANEIKTITVNGVPATFTHHDSNSNIFIYNFYLTSKSPQKINITIDEYIRYEDIVQPYPDMIELKQDNKIITWGDKLKVGSEVVFYNHININPLSKLYNLGGVFYNGERLYSGNIIEVKKPMAFTSTSKWILDNNEPKCILSPRLLRIPNSSYKILGYIPDISGHGNHGKINNSAYAEGSGVNEDGSYQFDGVDDFVTIPTLSSGGKQMLMKVNWKLNAANTGIIYDQRISTVPYPENMIISLSSDSGSLEERLAYMSEGRADITYIDGVLNKNITVVQLQGITHNITQCNDKVTNSNSKSPVIGFLSATSVPSYYAKMSLYDFMLFDNISTDDKIKELNEYVGIEGNTDDLFNETN